MPRGKPDGLPPCDTTAEEAVIAAVFLEPSTLDKCISGHLQPEDFYRSQNGEVLWACFEAWEDSLEPTIIVVSGILERHGYKSPVEGSWGDYLTEIVSRHFTAVGVEAHITIVRNTARLRKTIEAAGEIAKLASTSSNPVDVVQSGLSLLGKLLDDTDSGMVKLGYVQQPEEEGLEWGIPVLDRYTMGVVGGKLTIIAGASGDGKSFTAAQVARHVAEQGGRVAIFTMEMGNGEYESRIAHAIAGVRQRDSKQDPPYTEVETAAIGEARASVFGWDIVSNDRSAMTSEFIASRVRMLDSEKHVDLVIVDHLQLMGGVVNKNTNSAEMLRGITGSLKSLAMEKRCHVIVISQMNRSSLTELRTVKDGRLECLVTGQSFSRPFKESLLGGAVENDGDIVLMLQRHSGCLAPPNYQHHIELFIAKNRNGREAHSMVLDEFHLCRIRTMSEEEVRHAAHGDMSIYHQLMVSQGFYSE